MLAGLSHGIVYVAAIAHSSENAIAEMRGRQLSSLGMVSIFSAVIVTGYYGLFAFSGIIEIELMMGIVTILYAIIAFALAICYGHLESVVFLMRNGHDREAFEVMCKLRSEHQETWAIRNELLELQSMIDEEAAGTGSGNILSDGNAKPLLFCTSTKVMTFLGQNILLNVVLIAVTFVALEGNVNIVYVPLVLTVSRAIGTTLAHFFVDKIGRKVFISAVGGVAGAALLLLGILMMTVAGIGTVFVVVVIAFQVAVGFATDPMQHVITGEAFGVNKKAWSISAAVVVEQALHVAAMYLGFYLLLTTASINSIILICSIGLIVLAAIMYLTLPETRVMSLRRCRDEFGSTVGVMAEAGGTYRNARNNEHNRHGITYCCAML